MLGDNIMKIRKSKSISINNLSKITGVSLGYISDLENNKAKNPTMDKLKIIASALNVEIEEFFKSEPISKEKLKEWDGKYIKDIELTKNIIPEKFIIPAEARKYISMHQIFASKGFNLNKMTDKDILDFANLLLEQMKMVGYKYKK